MPIQIDEDKNDVNGEGNNEENPENLISEEEEKLEINPEEEIKELEDKLLRTVAEMDNMRKRSDKERSEAYKIGASIFIKEMLPIIDNLQRALASFVEGEGTDTKSFVDGANTILRDFVSLLDKTGVKTINPEGEKFDPNFHEAMFEAPSEDHEAGIIIQVIEHGYVLENRLLRAAKVGVSSKKNEEKPN
ncbi:MAG: nucleotide exchange factor GrpE [Alphaproteobacteria bacterium]